MNDMQVKNSPLIRRKGQLLVTEVDGELVGLSVDNGTCYGFNATATHVWTLLEEPKTFSDLCDSLMAQFDVDRATCEADVVGLIRDLEADGLVEVEGALPAA